MSFYLDPVWPAQQVPPAAQQPSASTLCSAACGMGAAAHSGPDVQAQCGRCGFSVLLSTVSF